MSRSFSTRLLASVALALSTTAGMATPVASAGPGYQLDSVKPSISLSAEAPIGVAIDQSSQHIYVAEVSTNLLSIEPGQIEQLTSAGTPTANSPFGTGGQDFFTAVAVNPVTHGIYAYQIESETPQGLKGVSMASVFSSTGVLGTSFSPASSETGTIATDAAGRLLFPSTATDSVQVYSPSGVLESSFTCAACPGGAFVMPQSVAVDSAGKVYVVDRAGGRVIKLSSSGAYESTLQSGMGAVAVAVDSSSDEVFVGARVGEEYHVVAYNSAGVAFDDFGSGLLSPFLVDEVSGQLAVNATTHRLYLSDPEGGNLWVFERVASIPAPTATIASPNPVGQVEATLRATVNPKGHVLTSCDFEYTDHADFVANGYANAETAPCAGLVGGDQAVTVSTGVKGLDPATSYDYRIKIASFGGAAESASQSFQTLPALPPEATTTTASSLTKTSATLGGTANPKGGLVSSCRFEYVTDASFQVGGFAGANSKACLFTPSGNVASAVSAKVVGLASGTGYRFRLVVTNNAGTTQAAAASFSTVAETCEENIALCPPPEAPQPPPSSAPAPVFSPPVVQRKPLKCRKGFRKKKVRGKMRCVRIKKRRATR